MVLNNKQNEEIEPMLDEPIETQENVEDEEFDDVRVPIGTVRFRFESYRNRTEFSVSVIGNLPNFWYR